MIGEGSGANSLPYAGKELGLRIEGLRPEQIEDILFWIRVLL